MKAWLLRPFDRVSGGVALGLGLLVLGLTAGLAWRVGLQTDGVLDLHFQTGLGLVDLLVQGLVNWLVLALLLLGFGRWLSSTPFRALDLLGTQALARWPILIGVLYLAIPAVGSTIERLTLRMLEAMPSEPDQVMASSEYLLDALWLTVISLPVLACIVWMVWLMYHGYAQACNLRGQRAVFSFIGALVLAEFLSKLLIFSLN
jgi:hypothetical protein